MANQLILLGSRIGAFHLLHTVSHVILAAAGKPENVFGNVYLAVCIGRLSSPLPSTDRWHVLCNNNALY